MVIMVLSACLLLAGCETPVPGGTSTGTSAGTNAGVEQLRAQLAPDMRRAGVSDACIQSLSFSALSAVKSAVRPGFGPGLTAGNVGLGNPRSQERGRIQAIARRECPDL
jgi:hypothetical protein